MNRKNITKLAFAIVILSFVLSTFVSLWSLRLMAQRNVQELSKSLAARIYDSINSKMSEPVNVSRAMAHDSFLIRSLENEDTAGTQKTAELLAEYLSGVKDAFDYEAAFVVSDSSKYYYSYGGLNKKMDVVRSARDLWYEQFVTSGMEYDLDMDRDELGEDQWTVFVDARIEDGSGRLLGVCGVGARMTGNQDLFSSLEREYGVRISLVDGNGQIQVDTDESRIESMYPLDIRLSESSDYVYQNPGSGRSVVTKYVESLDWYLVVESGGESERRQILQLLVLNIVLCAGVLIIMVLAVRIIIARTKALSHASFVDQPTQLLNRRAFEEKKEALSMAQLSGDFTYLTADLNGLKRVNDELGHAAGDELIRAAADCLKNCFGKYGRVYRIGGDEFAAMLNLSADQLAQSMAVLEESSGNWKGHLIQGFTISCGYATAREFPSENIAELGRISDERMYRAKEEYYKKTGNRR